MRMNPELANRKKAFDSDGGAGRGAFVIHTIVLFVPPKIVNGNNILGNGTWDLQEIIPNAILIIKKYSVQYASTHRFLLFSISHTGIKRVVEFSFAKYVANRPSFRSKKENVPTVSLNVRNNFQVQTCSNNKVSQSFLLLAGTVACDDDCIVQAELKALTLCQLSFVWRTVKLSFSFFRNLTVGVYLEIDIFRNKSYCWFSPTEEIDLQNLFT